MSRIIIEFIGGFRDGLRFDSASADAEESKWAWMWYRQFKDGKIGHTITSASDAAVNVMRSHKTHDEFEATMKNHPGFPCHYYQVVDRIKQGDSVTVRINSISKEEYEQQTQ